MSTLLQALVDTGFALDEVGEPVPDARDLAGDADFVRHVRRPPLLVVAATRT